MDLCDDIVKGLELLKDEQTIKHNELENLIRLVWKLMNSKCDDNLITESELVKLKDELNQLDYNQRKLFVCLECVYVETCRLNRSLDGELNELRSVLDSLKIQDNLKRLIVDAYKGESRDKLSKKLQGMRLDCKQQFIDQFKEIELTKDSVVKSTRKTNYRHIIQTEYLMNVQTDYTKHLFTCSIQNIEDLSIKFKEIMKTIDRVFTMVKK